MTAQYWIARYIPDVFRGEQRNVGVIVKVGEVLAARFVAERPDEPGTIDGRRASIFLYPDIYRQWVKFWRSSVDRRIINEILKAKTANFTVDEGGNVANIKGDDAFEVCDFLYTMLVSKGGATEAFFEREEIEKEIGLKSQLEEAFKDLQIMDSAVVAHPVFEDTEVQGQHAIHKPSFVQKNGHLFVYEVVDFTRKKQRLVAERAGWAAYMFSDIKSREPTAEAIAVVRLGDETDGALSYARDMLKAESAVLNWSNESERNRFLDERKTIAHGFVALNQGSLPGI